MIILGIDPGIAIVGYGVLEYRGANKFRTIAMGAIETPAGIDVEDRLAMIYDDMCEIIDTYHPDEMAVEELFFSKNITTGIAVAHARGVALLTCVKACGKLYEYTPMQIKQALTGYGRAEKRQIQSVVTSLLHLQTIPKPDDAADALAIALCHASASRFGDMFAVGNMTRTKGRNTNVEPLNAYQELMLSANKGSRGKKSAAGFSSAANMTALQNATGVTGITGVGRASATVKMPQNTKTSGAGTRSSKKKE